jgi:hypothetical protein
MYQLAVQIDWYADEIVKQLNENKGSDSEER